MLRIDTLHLRLTIFSYLFDPKPTAMRRLISMRDVDEKAKQLQSDGFKILRGPRRTGDGYYEFETLDPDDNRLEVTTKYYS